MVVIITYFESAGKPATSDADMGGGFEAVQEVGHERPKIGIWRARPLLNIEY